MTDPASRRPIVAELGRAETPDEKAARVAANRAKRRANQTTINLLLSIGASLLIVLFLIVVVVREAPAPPPIDYRATADELITGTDFDIVAPVVPPSWWVNRAGLSASGGVTEWYVGFVTDPEPTQAGFIALLQGFDANPTWLAEQLRQPRTAGDEVDIGGVTWTLYDRRGNSQLENRQYALVTETESSTIVLFGTAEDADFTLLATSIAGELTAP
ncbi:MAG: DUF4245 family protein [Microcella sp.]